MGSIFLTIGWLAGALGVLLTLVAAGARLTGYFWIGGISTGSVLQGGIAAMVLGCLGFLAALNRSRGASNH